MDWNAAGAIGEILGAVAVFLTLLYLAIQVKQTNKMARFETTREIMGQFNACNHLIATDAAIRAVLLKEGALSHEEAELLYSYADMYCNAWATVQIAFDEGLVDQALLNSVLSDVGVAIDRWPNIRQAFERWFSNYPEFEGSEFLRVINHHG